ncbi:GDSL-type esterase/lipase family protein [Plantactinospora sp. KLBMP9567]|uniref:GDSL-type esterase/lipase family protein n=1 Tax=Plantactinospora sp. KLBMP9567 TaxID=3085900 RepID=UPI002981A379|nr:GDSL-type esterase/lipase family protein [Plantactinospora sp. KLBMP9567]MDW5325094.1 GDSL-type esterase/lipase family protein [Plantactinospora sp. KLBMP9567]MDW5329295.1 GDSL-type esterase/lipase family protein [Plantactinospora sp. KLBMP9567]
MSATMRRCAGALLAAVLATVAILLHTGHRVEAAAGVPVLPLGDSITDGFNVPGGYRIDLWQKVVAGGYTVDFVGSQANGPASLGDRDHEGHSGWRIDQIDANIVNWLDTYQPRTILLHIGTNDIFQNRDLPNAPNRLAALIDRITTTAPEAKLFVATIVPAGSASTDAQVRSFNAAIPQIVQTRANAGRQVHLVDMYAALTAADLADGVHPNATGYSKMATTWYNALLAVPGSLTDGGTTPTPTATPSTPPTGGPSTPPTNPPAGCTASVSLNSWNGGFVATVRVTAGSAGTTGWTVDATLPSGTTITNAWNTQRSGSSGAVQFTNVSYNGRIAAGQSTEFGFQGTGTGAGLTPSCVAS